MICTVGFITIHIPYAQSLKEKRRVVKSVIARTIGKFSVSCIEADYCDLWQKAMIGIGYVSSDQGQADKIENRIRAFYEEFGEFEILDMSFEKFTV